MYHQVQMVFNTTTESQRTPESVNIAMPSSFAPHQHVILFHHCSVNKARLSDDRLHWALAVDVPDIQLYISLQVAALHYVMDNQTKSYER